jgi:hypothetical protein
MKKIMIGNDSRNTEDSEIDESVDTNEPQDRAVEWVHEVMKLSTAGMEVYNPELTRLVDELGINFVSQHFCEQAVEGGERCPEGHCELGEYCTCEESVRQYIEDFIGSPIEK